MKKFFGFVLFVAILLIFFLGCENKTDNSIYLRIHIRANDNKEENQAVKYAVKENLIRHLTPILSVCDTKKKAQNAVMADFDNIKNICIDTLSQNGFSYGCRVYISNEYFPLRNYNGFVFESGNYDALIIELGEGKGDNWWCMVYPPLCFTAGENDGSGKITYKSKILEIIEEFKKKYLS
jgi:stage II sporulation protein R